MTMRTTTHLRCACGHTGVLRTAENDAPFSREWFDRTVEGFIDHDDGFGIRKLACPACGQQGRVESVPQPEHRA